MRTVYRRRSPLLSLLGIALLLWLSAVPGWAGFEEGVHAYKSGDHATAFREWLPLAQQGDAGAQFLLGTLYAQGHGVPQDYDQAAQWFRRAAEQGHVGAQYNLGVRYHEGRGVPHDPTQAAAWFQRAAQQGFARAQYNLGVLYVHGDGVPRDDGQAAQWFRQAADQSAMQPRFEASPSRSHAASPAMSGWKTTLPSVGPAWSMCRLKEALLRMDDTHHN